MSSSGSAADGMHRLAPHGRGVALGSRVPHFPHRLLASLEVKTWDWDCMWLLGAASRLSFFFLLPDGGPLLGWYIANLSGSVFVVVMSLGWLSLGWLSLLRFAPFFF